MKADTIKILEATRVVAIIRGMAPEICVELARAYERGGIRLVEVTFDQTTDGSTTAAAIKAIRAACPNMIVGAGTVLTQAQLDMTIAAGGEFMVTPSTNPALIRAANAAGLVTLPGAFTPTEIVTAHEAGADYVKVFPVRSLGARYIKDLLAPLKHIKLLAVGGITPANAAEFIAAGCHGVGASGALVDKELIVAKAWDKIEQAARDFVAAVK